MTLYEFITRPLSHRWVAIARTNERIVTNAWYDASISARAELNRCVEQDRAPVKAKRAPRKVRAA